MVWRAIAKFFQESPKPARRRPRSVPLRVEGLEERDQPATASGVLTGTAFLDLNANGVRDAGDSILPGVSVTLKGKTSQGTNVNITATTDANGAFTILNVMPGTYTFQTAPVPGLLRGGFSTSTTISIPAGQTTTKDIGFEGLGPEYVTLRQFLTTPIDLAFSVVPPGTGEAQAASRANNTPTVSTTISPVAVQQNASPTTIDLAANFTDPDLTNSVVQFQTSKGNINFTLDDSAAPQTVANFLDYINSGKYDNTIFDRLVSGFVLQGGGFKLSTSGGTSSLTPISTFPSVQNEFSSTRSNTQWTLAMAKSPSGPNTATSAFFINLANNASNLDNQNGGFTVFGKLEGAADQAVVNNIIAAVTIKDLSGGNSNSPYANVPTIGYSGTAATFPGDVKASNLVVVNTVKIIKQDEALTYTATSSNTSLVTTSIVNENLHLNYVAGQSGTANITVTATDKFGATVSQTFAVTVNKKPTAINATASATTGTPVLVDVIGDNAAGNTGKTLTIQSFTQPTHGTVTNQSGKLQYVSNAAYKGADTFTYTLSDGAGGTATGNVDVTVS